MIRIADLFCGAGGESTGIIQACGDMGARYDLAAVNHWDLAIETHTRNHPGARHFCASIQTLNPLDVFRGRDRLDLLWASPECTHHSNARGGRPCSDQSRASAWLILKWLSELYVRRVILENVPEFVNWGPLGHDGRPLPSQKGATFRAFVAAMESMGYRVEWKFLCAADYGDPTTRTRFFLQAVRGKGRIEWPTASHAERPGLFGEKPWVPAREIIDWSIRGESITSRKRSLAPATMRRIEAGIRRYWGEWAEPFLVVLRGTGSARDLNQPAPAITAGGLHLGLVEPFMVAFNDDRDRKNKRTPSINAPLGTVTAGAKRFGIVEPFLFTTTHGGRSRELDRPMPTVTGANRGEIGVVEPFIMSAGGPECGARPASRPVGTVLTRDHRAVVEPFLVQYYGNGVSRPVKIPLGTQTTKDKFGLVEGQPVGLDITFRMLQPHELAAAQGFPRDYQFAGNKGDQVKQIGNAVPVNLARALSALAAA